jgi:hypothetical protein
VPGDHPSPLFIVGSPRSGTSILVAALLHTGAYHGFKEGNFLGLLEQLHRTTDSYFATFWSDNPRLMLSRVDRRAFKAGLSDLFRRIIERENPVAPWLDKSGNSEVIRLIPVLLELWPSSHFIFARRRGIENIVSRRKKFPEHSFEFHCKDWASNMSAWRRIRRDLPALRCLEVEQLDLVREPERAAAELGDFLGFSAGQRTGLVAAFRHERPEQTAADSAERVLSLRTAGWSPQEVALFMQHCNPEMERFGYSLDETYRTAAPQGRRGSGAADGSMTDWIGEIVPEGSLLGDSRLATLHLDSCTITEGNTAVLEGWALASDLSYVDSIDVSVGNEVKSQMRPERRRTDVQAARRGAQGPDCGFVIRFQMDRIEPEATFVFAVKTKSGTQRFRAQVRFHPMA